ncbi:GNAT superfamily N-acetyltransferase [Mycolicibacterium sp. BK556]|uniref:GNAT family N-acetyltransferase n=1 Tax=Mycobacteriaceae TaxID=1762 RepID=UPI00104FD394|nr:GNAT family N-acetyltransferase [Mycobacterium sp. BK086]MBB3606591.1 GNAT superfamily N-acetyltransferase [Mycolicibacterium sp. BK556]MBB3636163.1 GNAT superfamily N-acetyltransferase [Mycolicibacterium sp. BK607]MBB3753823.1 GNAT superfamily N-acetyltransferase [Mycolicibacterium sp. BK634]TDO06626.1 acetyltransferase (GNAT) family protein [Mycobacterium sp. BK086]
MTNFDVRFADRSDLEDVRTAIASLLVELSGDVARMMANFESTYQFLVSRHVGGVLVARESESREIAGVLTYSKQAALRAGGQYCLIQELWVTSSWRSHGIGARLIKFLRDEAAPEISQFEVGLPGPGFPRRDATQAFYERLGFAVIGVRAQSRSG